MRDDTTASSGNASIVSKIGYYSVYMPLSDFCMNWLLIRSALVAWKVAILVGESSPAAPLLILKSSSSLAAKS